MAAALHARPAERYSKDSLHDLGSPPSRFIHHNAHGHQSHDPFAGMKRTARGLVVETEDGERLVSARDSSASLASELQDNRDRHGNKSKSASKRGSGSHKSGKDSRKHDKRSSKENDSDSSADEGSKDLVKELRFVHDKEVSALQAAITKLQQDLADKTEQ